MYKRGYTALLLIQLALVNYSEQQQYYNQPSSPCPGIFDYNYDGNSWYGVVTTNSPRYSSRALLKVQLSLRAQTQVYDNTCDTLTT